MLKRIILSSIAILMLLSGSMLALGQFEQWVPCVPRESQVELAYHRQNGISYVDVSIEFASSGFNISSWGTPTILENDISVNAEIWRWTGIDLPVVITVRHTYALGELALGEYRFTFRVWGFMVKTITFVVRLVVPDDYPTIQEAIDNAKEGDTIFVRNGTYYENIYISKSISLVGENKDTTIIDGNALGNVIAIYANSVMVRGFTVQHSGFFLGLPSGIEIGSLNCAIVDNIIFLNKGGISLLFGGNHTISSNTISSNYYGMNIIYSENNRIFHNNFLNNTQQVYTTGSINTWDNGCEGNFWSNYNGSDLNGDGVGDEYLPWEGVDNYPLMNMYWNPCDVNHDLEVDITDVASAAYAYGSHLGHPKWNPHADITSGSHLVPDGEIDIQDVSLIAYDFGKTYA